MITIIKEAKEILEKIEGKKIKEKLDKIKPNSYNYYLVNLSLLLKKTPLNVYYKNIDYLTAEIKDINSNLINILSVYLPSYNHKMNIEKHQGLITDFKHIKILDKFYLVNLCQAPKKLDTKYLNKKGELGV